MINVGILASQVSSVEEDPYWDDVYSLLHMDGAIGSTSFPDEKGLLWVNSSGVQLVSSVSGFGQQGGFLGVSGSGLSSTPSFTIDNGFTVEAWITRTASASSTAVIVGMQGPTSVMTFYWNGANRRLAVYSGFTGAFIGSTTLVLDQRYHVALTRLGNIYRLFVDGNLVGSKTDSNVMGTFDQLTIGGSLGLTSQMFQGMIDEVRLTVGVARYTASFTPRSRPFPSA